MQMEMPLVSVIVPIYHVEDYLNRCIVSIVNQTYQNLEIILVDDGSRDNCPQMCDSWAEQDSRVSVIHKENAGLGMARNTGIEHAAGKYIFFLDSDDYVDTTLIEKCVNNAEAHGSEVVCFGRSNVYEDGRIEPCRVSDSVRKYCGEAVRKELLPCLFTYELGFGVSAWGRMYRLHTLRSNQLRFVSEREIISEDAFFSLELFSRVSVVTIIPEPLYFYCCRNTSLSRRYEKGRQARNDDFLIKSMEYVDRAGLPNTIKTHIQARYHGMTLGTMMQVVRSNLPGNEKRRELSEILHNKTLYMTLSKDVCSLDARFPRLFWTMLKFKQYTLCEWMLYCNALR